MNRRSFLKGGGLAAALATVGVRGARGIVPAHNWGKYDFGSGPVVTDRLNQGPFPASPPQAIIPGGPVVMTTTPSQEAVHNYGRGLETYITADMGTAEIKSDNIPQAIEDLVKFPLGDVLYMRPTWREVQPHPGRLDFPDYIKLVLQLAKENHKRVAFRIQMSAPDYVNQPALPDFVLKQVPMVQLKGNWDPNHPPAEAVRYLRNPYGHSEPRYDNPFFQKAFAELVGLLAAEFNGNPLIEYMDTFMYGFWGEGHTWPFPGNIFPDDETAERTWINMLRVQLEHFTKTPLLTNTQPDIDRVGNSEILDRTVRSNNWIRSDTIFIENEQIEELGNRPPWIGMALEQPLPGNPPQASSVHEGVSSSDDIIAHVMDIGANYWSLWNFHDISAKHLMNWYQAYPKSFDLIHRRIGYNVRPSFIWSYEHDGYLGLIIGFANDGIAGVPGVLRVTVQGPDKTELQSGCLDPGYPYPGKVRQAQFVLPKGTKWQGLRLKAEIEVKGAMRRPVRWACQQKLNEDGTLTLRPNGEHRE
jgi:hypothetical protein